MSKENLKKGKITPEEIANGDAEKIVEEARKGRDHYKNRTKKIWDQTRGVMEIRDIPQDPYKGISKKSKIEGNVDNTTGFDKKAYENLRDE